MAGARVELERLGAPLRLRGAASAELEALLEAAADALFELAGAWAVADVEGIGPRPAEAWPEARWGAVEGGGDHDASAILEVTVIALADDAVTLAIAWRGRGSSGRVERRFRWCDRAGARQAIPASARVGLRALAR